MRINRKICCAGFFSALVIAIPACGPKEVTNKTSGNSIVGKVYYGDEQVQFAMVLVSSGGQISTGFIGEDGTYKVDNVAVGEALIGVHSEPAKGDYVSKSMGSTYQGPTAKGSGKASLKWIDVPAKFNKPETSGVKTTINVGENKYDIKLPR
jgi:hypothetical protein